MGTVSNQTNLTVVQQSSLKSVSQKRVKKELEILLKRKPAFVKELIVDPKNERQWKVTILPNVHPFNLATIRLSVNIHEDYPFKPPHLLFITSIWHPNINAKGEICASILQIENWKPSTTITAILEAVVSILDNPDVGRFINEEAAEIYVNVNLKAFSFNNGLFGIAKSSLKKHWKTSKRTEKNVNDGLISVQHNNNKRVQNSWHG